MMCSAGLDAWQDPGGGGGGRVHRLELCNGWRVEVEEVGGGRGSGCDVVLSGGAG